MALPNPLDNPPKAKNRDNPKRGAHYARVVGITDLGIQPAREWQGKHFEAAQKVEVTFELPNSKMEDGRPHWISKKVPVGWNVSETDPSFTSGMMRIVLAVNPEEDVMDAQILNRCLTKPCQVMVSHNEKGYANIDSVTGVPDGTPVPELANPSFIFDWTTATKEDFEDLRSPLSRKAILGADNYATSPLRARIEQLPASDEELPF